VQARDAGRIRAQELGREVPQGADDARLDQLHLAQEVLVAVLDLLGMGIAVAGRAALQRVADEDVAALQPDLLEQLVQQLAGLADERQPLLVLVAAGRLPDEHQVGVGVARAEDHGGAGRGELGAAGAIPRLVVDGLERLPALLLRRRHDPSVDIAAAELWPRSRNLRNSVGQTGYA
jgi:hypothetical protein